MNTLVVNCSKGHYNLGASKIANWLREEGHQVTMVEGDPGPLLTCGYDKVFLSVIFTWHAPIARNIALRVNNNSDVECGGPGIFKLSSGWTRETGLRAKIGLDKRFDRQPGEYLMTFASRGCDEDCTFCIVPGLEGRKFTLDWNFRPAPILADNNISALPMEFQEHIISRYRETRTALKDANSGFSPSRFTQMTYWRWKKILKGPWRFALDEMKELDAVERTLHILRNVRARRKQVYCLVGDEPISLCYDRAMRILELGGEPFCQPVLPLDWMHDPRKEPLPAKHDWTDTRLRDFCRYFNRRLYRTTTIREYNNRKNEQPPFKNLIKTSIVRVAA